MVDFMIGDYFIGHVVSLMSECEIGGDGQPGYQAHVGKTADWTYSPAPAWSLYFSLLLLPTEYQELKWIYFKDIPAQMQKP